MDGKPILIFIKYFMFCFCCVKYLTLLQEDRINLYQIVSNCVKRFHYYIFPLSENLKSEVSNLCQIFFTFVKFLNKMKMKLKISNIFYFWKISERNEIENIKCLIFAIFSRFSKIQKNIIVKTFDAIWYFYQKQHFSSIYCIKIRIA